MAQNPRNFAKENFEKATEAASSGANWMAQLADYNLRQSMAALDGMLTMVRRAADGASHHASAMREHAQDVAQKAVENPNEFANRMVHLKDPLEWAQVHGNFYGTPRVLVEAVLAQGRDVIFDIDYQGTQQVRAKAPDDVVTIFVLPPSMPELRRRLERNPQTWPRALRL